MALDYQTIRSVERVGNDMHIHYVDGKTVIAYSDGRQRFMPRRASAGAPPGTYEPVPDPDPELPPQTGGWFHPLVGASVTSTFGYRWGGFHYGLDLSTTTAPTGGPVRAVANMVITRAYDAFEGGNETAGTYVKGNNGTYTFTYAHGANESLMVGVGETVMAGDTLFTEGATGNVTGTHLHLEIIQGVHADPWAPPYNNGAQFLDPLPLLRANGVNI